MTILVSHPKSKLQKTLALVQYTLNVENLYNIVAW